MAFNRFALCVLSALAWLAAGCDSEPVEAPPQGSAAPPAATGTAGAGDAGEAGARAAEETRADVPEYTIEEFLATTSYGGASFSPDNSKVLVHSNESGIFNLYALPVGGGDGLELTRSTTDAIFSAGYFPEDERVLYSSDEGGNELRHVFVRELDGTTRDLTPGEGHRAVPAGWLYDYSRFLVMTNERDERFMDLYAYDPETYARTMLYRNDDAYDFGGISPDGRYLALGKTVTNADSDIYVHDLMTRDTTLVTEHEGAVNHFPGGFAPDGRLLYLTDRDSEFVYAVARDLATGEETVLAQPDWDVMYAYFSRNGRYLVVGVNEDARTKVDVIDTQSGEPVALPEVENASIVSVSISDDERYVAMYASSSRTPNDLFVQPLPDGSARPSASPPTQLTMSLSPAIDPAVLVDGEVVRFASFDGLEIPGILYMPRQAAPENKVPAIVMVHGGPGGQSRIGYDELVQYLVNHGYAVYAINNRGSSGYGKTFFHLDDRAHGEGDLDDCVASKRMLSDTGLIDPERIAILGGSYGGYMVLAALAFRPEAFDAGVDIFGISNWYRTVQNIPPWWESAREALSMEMGDFDDEEYFRSISPLFHADAIVRPLLVIQGANDPRVLKVESDEIVAAVRENGVPVEYIVFADEGHGFVKRENQAVAYRSIREFLDMHL